MASFLKKVQKGAQQVHKSATSGQLASNLKQSFNQAKSNVEEQIQDVLRVDYDKYLERPLVLEGKIWKRRGGMAKYHQNLTKKKQGDSVWELRRFELRGTTLLYFTLPPSDEEEIKFGGEGEEEQELDARQHGRGATTLADSTWTDKSQSMRQPEGSETEDLNTPRGHIDFKQDKALVHVSPGHHQGAPSPFCLSIVTVTGVTLTTHSHAQTKWMLSFDHQSAMMEWLTALSNVVAQCSADSYNVQLVKAANPNNRQGSNDPPIPFLRRPPIKEPPKQQEGDLSSSCDQEHAKAEQQQVQSAAHQLWIAHNNYYVFRKDEEESYTMATATSNPQVVNTTTARDIPSPAALKEMEHQHQQELQRVMEETQESVRQEMQQQVVQLETKAAQEMAQKDQEIATLQTKVKEWEGITGGKKTSSELAAEIETLQQKIHDLEASELAKIEEVTKAAAIGQKLRQQQQDKEIANLKQQIQTLQESASEAQSKSQEAALSQAQAAEAEIAKLKQQIESLQQEQQAAQSKSEEAASAHAKAASRQAEAVLAQSAHDKKVIAQLQQSLQETQSTYTVKMEELQSMYATKLQDLTQAAETAQSQQQEKFHELQGHHQTQLQELQGKVEEMAKAATEAKEQHEKEVLDLQQTIQLLQSAPPDDDDDDEFHDAM